MTGFSLESLNFFQVGWTFSLDFGMAELGMEMAWLMAGDGWGWGWLGVSPVPRHWDLQNP